MSLYVMFDEKELQLVLECRTITLFEKKHQFCNAYALFINTVNDIILSTIGEAVENKCIKLAVIICCKRFSCFPDFIFCKIPFVNYIRSNSGS